jgi:hypothetical protein
MSNPDPSCKPEHVGGMTLLALEKFFTLWISKVEELFKTRIDSMEEARRLALAAMDKRLDGMNELREALRDQRATYFTKESHELYQKQIELEIRSLQDFKLTLDTKASTKSVNLATGLAVGGFVISSISFVLLVIHVLLKGV